MKKGVYAGSFDPLTKGHLWMIEEGSKLFDELVVSIGMNPNKDSTFSVEERIEMLKGSIKKASNIKIEVFKNQFLVNHAQSLGAQYILRGIRTEKDYEYERETKQINHELNPKISSIFLLPPQKISPISSSLVKSFILYEHWEDFVEKFVPRNVYNQFLIKFNGLKKRWSQLCKRVGIKGFANENYKELCSLYGEKHRAYHNLVHIAHILQELDFAKKTHKDHCDEIEMALWYHDAIYDPKATNNEEKSATLAEKHLSSAGAKKTFIESVVKLILATKHTSPSQKKDEQLLTDIDLSILGKAKAEFDEYENDIRFEYNWVPITTFKKKRKAILQRFLDRNAIYTTECFRKKYEEQARKNIKWALDHLNQKVKPF